MNVLFIIPGPSYNISSSTFKLKYKYLSIAMSGVIFTTSSGEENIDTYNFSCHATKYADGMYSNMRFILFCIERLRYITRKGIKIDMIVTYDPLKTGIIGWLLKKMSGAKLVVEVNGVYNSPVVWEDSRNKNGTRVKKWLLPLVIQFVLNRADGIKLLFPSQIEGCNLDCSGKVIASYFDWVNTELFDNLEEKKEVLFVGFPYKIKGVDILIKAFKQVAEKYPDWNLKILGWYPDMRELDAAIDAHPQIFHHPPVPSSEIPEHIGRCGFLVLPSRTEAMGRVLIEAMAAGKARIGTRVDGIPTVINDGKDGFLVEPENVEKLAEKMDLLMGDDELRKRLGDASAARAKKNFTASCYLQSTIRFYHQVIER